jgi:hypothetical protein
MRDNSAMWERFENEGLERRMPKKKVKELKKIENKANWQLHRLDTVRNREPGNYAEGKLWEKKVEIEIEMDKEIKKVKRKK